MFKQIKAVGTIGRAWADTVHTRFADSLANLLTYENSKLPQGKYVHYTVGTVSWHEQMRNQLVEDMQGEWILMLDTDHCFSPDLLERLLRIRAKYKAPVVSGIYTYKFPPHAPVVNFWNADDNPCRLSPMLEWDRTAEAIEVGAVGAGCLLIDRKLLKRIELELNEAPFSIIPGLSEDYSFCLRCKKLGVPVLLAPQVECHHMVPNILHVNDYRPDPAMLKPAKVSEGKIV